MGDPSSHIRLFSQSDTKRVLAMEHDRFKEPLTQTLLKYLLKKYTSDYFYVLDVNENGKIDAYLFSGIETDHWSHILSIAVSEEYEGRGYAKSLVNHLIGQTRLFCKGIRLEVRTDNARAIHLYDKLGFKRIDLAKNYYGKDHHAYIMELDFSEVRSL